LENVSFKNAVICEYANLVYDGFFLNELDENPNLLSFKNGVYDLKKCYFRCGYPDDNISLSTDYDYQPLIDVNRDLVLEINQYLDSLLPNRDDFMNLISSCLAGSLDENKIHLMVGRPVTGIVRLFQFIREVFGGYFDYGNNNHILKSGRHTSTKKGIRICLLDQLERDDLLTTKYLEQYNSREQKCDGNVFRPQFKTFLISDCVPQIDPIDSQNVLITTFNSNYLLENREINLRNKFSQWKPIFMSMLISRWEKQFGLDLKV
jgi:hypothetical protein